MEHRAGDRRRSLAIAVLIAVLAGAVVVLTPLVVGVARGQRPDVDVVNLRDYPEIDDRLLREELEAAGPPSGVLLIIPPGNRGTDKPFDCRDESLPESCPLLHRYARRVVLSDTEAGGAALTNLYGEGAADDEQRTAYVVSGRQPLGDTFAWGAATKVGLVMALVAAVAFVVVLRLRPRRLVLSAAAANPGPDPARPVRATASAPAAAPLQRMSSAPVHAASTPPPPPAPRKPAPPRPEPLPPDAIPATGDRVVARTPFGPHGGYVDAGGLVLWASLAEPSGHVHPGRPLIVVGPDRGRHSLVVSPHVTEEARP